MSTRKGRKRGGRSSKNEFSATPAHTRQTSSDTGQSGRRGTEGETNCRKKKKSNVEYDDGGGGVEGSTMACDLSRQTGTYVCRVYAKGLNYNYRFEVLPQDRE